MLDKENWKWLTPRCNTKKGREVGFFLPHRLRPDIKINYADLEKKVTAEVPNIIEYRDRFPESRIRVKQNEQNIVKAIFALYRELAGDYEIGMNVKVDDCENSMIVVSKSKINENLLAGINSSFGSTWSMGGGKEYLRNYTINLYLIHVSSCYESKELSARIKRYFIAKTNTFLKQKLPALHEKICTLKKQSEIKDNLDFWIASLAKGSSQQYDARISYDFIGGQLEIDNHKYWKADWEKSKEISYDINKIASDFYERLKQI